MINRINVERAAAIIGFLLAVPTYLEPGKVVAATLTKKTVKIVVFESAIGNETRRDDLSKYRAYLKNIVEANWLPGNCESGKRRVSFNITAQGEIRTTRLEKSSGNSQCDNAVLEAVNHSAPLAVLPSGLKQVKVEVEFGEVLYPWKPLSNAP